LLSRNFVQLKIPVRRKGPNSPHIRASTPGRAARRRAWALPALAALLACTLPVRPSHADEGAAPFRDTYGEVGLLEIPSARMADDGQLSFTVGALKNTNRFAIGFQILPWLEGSFRYSSIQNFNGNVTDFDRSFGLKMRLFQETEYIPDISLGMRDIVGTGIYGAEYLVATKKLWDFELTAGLGWGRLADNATFTNPFAELFSSFKVRAPGGGTNTGQVEFGQLFHGPNMGVFGGLKWNTPIDNVAVIAEYGSDHYVREARDHVFNPRTPFNVGLAWRPLSDLTLTGGWLYGTSWGAIASLSLDPTQEPSSSRLGPQPLPVQQRSEQEQQHAVEGYVKQTTSEAQIDAGGAWVGADATTPDSKVELVSRVANGSAAVRNAEIDGRTLVVDVRSGAVTTAQCEKYAKIAATSTAPVDSVAIVDLDHGSGSPILCPAPRPQLPRTIYASLEQQMETFSDVGTGGGAPADAAPPPDALDKQAVESNVRTAAAAQGLRIEAIGIGTHEIVVYYSNTTYFLESDAIGRMARILLAATPASVEAMRLVAVVSGVPQQEVEVLRAPLERMFAQRADTIEIAQAISLKSPPLDHPLLDEGQSGTYPRFTWSLSPVVRQELFDPNEPVQIQLLGALVATLQILPGLSLNTQLEGNIYNDFNFTRTSNSVLPHVRSDFAEYLKHGINGISDLYASYDTRLAPDVFVEAKAGYLEDMFAGGGLQGLWRPEDERWALGFDVYDVWQRSFDRLFGFRPYHVVTGHVNVYYQSPWYGINFAVHAGRYLAGDYGATFEVTREFLTDVEIGAFATFTNVPFAKFGEGSFDKGLIIRIPLDWVLPFNTQSSYDLDLRPLTRDGGQRLVNDDSLYDETRGTSYGEIVNHLEDIGYP
jgi:hypothetical protein